MAYATTDQLKAALSITGTDQDSYLSAILDRVSAFIDTRTNRTFSAAEATVTDELYERQGSTIWLRSGGIKTVSAVKVKDTQGDTYVTLDPGTYDWTSSGRLSLPLGYKFVQVTYTVAAGTVPKDIEGAAIDLAAEAYRSGGPTGAVSSERIGDLSLTYRSGSSAVDSALSMLDSYRVRPV